MRPPHLGAALGWSIGLAAIPLLLAGCRPKPTCGPRDAGCDGEGTLVHDGLTRTYRYHLPRRSGRDAGPQGLRPLVLALHGAGGTAKGMVSIPHFTPLSDAEGFVVAYPDGLSYAWNDGRDATAAARRGADDVGFLSALIDHLVATYAVDPRRVYVTGLSNGAMMSYRLACEIAGKIAAIAPVAGLHPEPLAACKPARPVPVMIFAGTADPLVPFGGGQIVADRGRVLSADRTFDLWASLDGCSKDVTTSDEPHLDPDDPTRVHRREHPTCAGGAAVVLYSVEGGGHTWPLGKQYLPEGVIGRTSRDLDATRVMWRFFEAMGAGRR